MSLSLPLSLFFFLRHVSCLLTYEFVYIVTYVYIVMYPMSGESNKLKIKLKIKIIHICIDRKLNVLDWLHFSNSICNGFGHQ